MQGLEIGRWPEGRPLDKEAVAEAWQRDGFGCNVWIDPPGQQWLNFVHAMDERVLVQEGTIEFEIEGVRAVLGPGEGVFIPAGSRHSVWNRGPSTARWLYGYKHQ